jgi:hypothetical protein
MSLFRLLLSGLLVASGLILGAFTLHGYFDPQWAQRQTQAAAKADRAAGPKGLNTFPNRTRFITSRADRADPDSRPQASAGTITRAHNPQGSIKAADTKPAAKPASKRAAEKAKKAPPPQQQQASFVWPWNLFNN